MASGLLLDIASKEKGEKGRVKRGRKGGTTLGVEICAQEICAQEICAQPGLEHCWKQEPSRHG